MWSFLEVVRVEQNWGRWHALVTLSKAGVPESFYLKFAGEPTPEQAEQAGRDYALRRNLDEAPDAPSRTVTREDFVGRFTLQEIGAIYSATAGNASLLAFTKRLEFNPTVQLDGEDCTNGLALLEEVGLIGSGRASAIRAG